MANNTKQPIATGAADSEAQKNQEATVIENQNAEAPKATSKPRTRVSKTIVTPAVEVAVISEEDNSVIEEITLTTEIMSTSEKDKDKEKAKIKKAKHKLKLKKKKEKEKDKEKAKKAKKKAKDKKAKAKKVKKAKAKKLEKAKAKKKKKAKNKKK